MPNHVIGGFHLYNPSRKRYEDIAVVRQIGEYLKNTGSRYYTCHCTGIGAYKPLKEIIGERIEYMAAGNQLIV